MPSAARTCLCGLKPMCLFDLTFYCVSCTFVDNSNNLLAALLNVQSSKALAPSERRWPLGDFICDMQTFPLFFPNPAYPFIWAFTLLHSVDILSLCTTGFVQYASHSFAGALFKGDGR